MTTPVAEQARRAALLRRLMEEQELDTLLLAANDYRGHKGALRWVADYNLVHRYGFVAMARDADPELILPENLALGRPGTWDVPAHFVRETGSGLVEWLRQHGEPQRIGIVGLGQVMKVEDYLAVRAAFPDAEIVDVGDSFERIRSVKTEEELDGVRESTRIAEACFERLLEVTRPGVTERAVGAAAYECCYALGGEDPLFLAMTAVPGTNGRVRGEFGAPGGRVLEPGSMLIFSFELIGPAGYWMELARMVTIDEPSDVQRRMNAAVTDGMNAARDTLTAGADPGDVQQAIETAVEAHDARCAYWSGHGLGQDVIEEPWVGLEVVQDRARPPWTIDAGMAISIHPFVIDDGGQAIGYMANTYLTKESGPAEVASSIPLDIFVVS